MRRVGLFGGTFDPVHCGHLHLVNALVAAHHLDEVWWVLAKQNPFKATQPVASFSDRAKMLSLAIAGFPAYRVYLQEGQREGPSYTIDTVRAIFQSHDAKRFQFYLLMSEETAQTLPRWREIEKVLQIAPPLVGSRSVSKWQIPDELPEIKQAIRQGITPMQPLQVSSTEIRIALLRGLDVSASLPQKVIDYILEKNLYSAV